MKTPCIILAVILFSAFRVTAQDDPESFGNLLVYKTTRDYTNLVPVTLSENKSKIISYPDPRDLRKVGKGVLPTRLHGGYFVDNIGISANTAFLNITYNQYVNLKRMPTAEELYKYILDKDPLVVLCDCGPKSSVKNPEILLNPYIDKKILQDGCKTLLKRKQHL